MGGAAAGGNQERRLQEIKSIIEEWREVQAKCKNMIERHSKNYTSIKSERKIAEQEIRDLRQEMRAIDLEISSIGFKQFKKMMQIKIRYQFEIREQIREQKLELAVMRLKEAKARMELGEARKLQKRNKVLDVRIEKLAQEYEDEMRKMEEKEREMKELQMEIKKRELQVQIEQLKRNNRRSMLSLPCFIVANFVLVLVLVGIMLLLYLR